MDLCMPTLKCLLADECQHLCAMPKWQDYSIFRKDGSEASTEGQDVHAGGGWEYWGCQGRNSVVWYVAMPPTVRCAAEDDADELFQYRHRPSQAEVLVELRKWKAKSKASFDEWKAESKTAFNEL
uniref:Uncharacterized protein n=1 Tax=Romanomermis culicivorax TaxID=13658 RepID=A0A915JAD1_ROMCU